MTKGFFFVNFIVIIVINNEIKEKVLYDKRYRDC
jgi:hypothetical protein